MRNLSFIVLTSILFSCSNSEKQQSALLKEIAALDSIQRKAHYERDALLLGSIMADSFYVASKGRISWSTQAKMITGFKEYFKTTRYSYWENVDTPLVDLSGNELAVVTYQKKTISTEGNTASDTTLFAWAFVLKKIDGLWKFKGIITTDDQ